MAETGKDSSTKAGIVDKRGTLKPGQWDRSGAGEIEDGSLSSVGADPSKPHNDSKTSAGV